MFVSLISEGYLRRRLSPKVLTNWLLLGYYEGGRIYEAVLLARLPRLR
jgi:hypothetical protein